MLTNDRSQWTAALQILCLRTCKVAESALTLKINLYANVWLLAVKGQTAPRTEPSSPPLLPQQPQELHAPIAQPREQILAKRVRQEDVSLQPAEQVPLPAPQPAAACGPALGSPIQVDAAEAYPLEGASLEPLDGLQGESPAAVPPPAPLPSLQLSGGQTLATFMASWDRLTARLLPRDSTGAAADMLLASIRLLLSTSGPACPIDTPAVNNGGHEVGSQPAGSLQCTSAAVVPPWSPSPAAAVRPGFPSPDAVAAQSGAEVRGPLGDGPGGGGGAAALDVQRLLAVAMQLADLSAAGLPLDAAAIAAGVLADSVHCRRLTMPDVEGAVGPHMAQLMADVASVHDLTEAVDVYDDATSRCEIFQKLPFNSDHVILVFEIMLI